LVLFDFADIFLSKRIDPDLLLDEAMTARIWASAVSLLSERLERNFFVTLLWTRHSSPRHTSFNEYGGIVCSFVRQKVAIGTEARVNLGIPYDDSLLQRVAKEARVESVAFAMAHGRALFHLGRKTQGCGH
jgi:hypothetical protein